MNLPINSINSRVQVDALPIEQLAGNQHVSESEKTKEVARQFESVLLRQILQSANKTGIKGMFEDEDSASKDVYFDMMNFHLADTISHAGGLGLASALEAQLQRQTPGAKPEGDEPAH